MSAKATIPAATLMPAWAHPDGKVRVARCRNKLRPSLSGLLSLISIATFTFAHFSFSADAPDRRLKWSPLPPLPEKAGLGGCFAGVSGGALLVAGGSNFPDKKIWEGGLKAWHDTVYVLTETNGRWRNVGKLPRPLAYGISVTTRRGVVCIGGADATQHYAEVAILSWSRRGLEVGSLPSLAIPLAYGTGDIVGDVIYVIGGRSHPGAQTASGEFLAIDLSKRQPAWQELEPCPGKARILAVAGALNGAFYYLGGVALESSNGKVTRDYLRDVWRYRPGKGWQRLADLPYPCSAGATPAPTFDAELYVIGGDDGSLAGFQPIERHPGFSKRILTYRADSNTWTSHEEAPMPSATVQTAVWRGRFVLCAGEPRPGMRSSEAWALSLLNDN